MSLVTKSGTNEFHGDLFEFVRNGIFNARNAFATKARHDQAQPVRRNRWRADHEEQIVLLRRLSGHDTPAGSIRHDHSFVPTAAMLAGDFTAFASPACNAGRQITLRAPFVNNRIDPALFSKAAVDFPEAAAAELRSVRQNHLRQPSLENGLTWSSAESTISGATSIPCSAGILATASQPAGVYA